MTNELLNSHITSGGAKNPLVNIVLADEGWIFEHCAREIEKRLDYVLVSKSPEPSFPINYYLNFTTFQIKQPGIDIGFFTHIEPQNQQQFFSAARKVDACVCQSARYANELVGAGIKKVYVISPGVDFDLYKPIIKIGVVGRTYPTGRKGEDLIRKLMDEPGIEWHFTGGGWPGPAEMYPDDQMPNFYNSVDYILISSYYEAGPMSILEALACGREVIAPPVGSVPDFPHIEYQTGNPDDLRRVLRELKVKQAILRESVLHYSWEDWVRKHDALFRSHLKENKLITIPRRKIKRVLLAMNSDEVHTGGGPSIRLKVLQEEMEKIGIEASISSQDRPDTIGFDLLHAVNVYPPHLSQPKLERLQSHSIPIILSPIYLELSEYCWATKVIPSIFKPGRDSREIDEVIKAYPQTDRLLDDSVNGKNELYPGFFSQVRESIRLADYLIGLSQFEMEHLWSIGVTPKPYRLVRNGVNYAQFENGNPDIFTQRYHIRDYVLCVGRIEPRKNQLMLIQALKGTGIPLVLLGQEGADTEYTRLVRAFADENVLITGRLPHDDTILASAYAGAKAFCLPSWAEGAPLAALEAGSADVPLALSDRSGEYEYFGNAARYCDPFNVEQLRSTLLEIYETHEWNRENRELLKRKLQHEFTWENAARETFAVYFQAFEHFEPRLVSQINHYQATNRQYRENNTEPVSTPLFQFGQGISNEPGWSWIEDEGHITIFPHSEPINFVFHLHCADQRFYSIFPFTTEILIDGETVGKVIFIISNQAQQISLPFLPTQKNTDLCIKSDSRFIPLQVGLNQDDRHLTVLIKVFQCITWETIKVSSLNEHFGHITITELAPETESDGFYKDESGWRWLRTEGHIHISQNLLPAKFLFKLRCSSARFYTQVPLTVGISVNKQSLPDIIFDSDGQEKKIAIYLPDNQVEADIQLKANATFIPYEHNLGDDRRELSVQMGQLTLLPKPVDLQYDEPQLLQSEEPN